MRGYVIRDSPKENPKRKKKKKSITDANPLTSDSLDYQRARGGAGTETKSM